MDLINAISTLQALGVFRDVGADGVKAYWLAVDAAQRLGDRWGVLNASAEAFAAYWTALYTQHSEN